MKKMTKRFLTLFLSIFMILAVLPVTAFAANYSVNYWEHNEPNPSYRQLYYNRNSQQYGDDVKWFQCAINNLVINGDVNNSRLSTNKLDVDGYFGPASNTALIAFQKKYNLVADGYFGNASLSKMRSVLRDYSKHSSTQQPTQPTQPTHQHSYTFQRAGYNLNRVCSTCGATIEKGISYQRYLTIASRSDTLTAFCTYLNLRGYTELSQQYGRAGYNPNIFLYYHKKNQSDNSKAFEKECNWMIEFEKKKYPSEYTANNCIKICVSTDAQMKDVWNNLIPTSIKNIHMFFHGGPSDIYFDNCDLAATEISKMNYKTISGNLYLYSCYGAGTTQSNFKGSPLRAFRGICSANIVVACANSGVNYTGTSIDIPASANNIIQALDSLFGHYYPVRANTAMGYWIKLYRDGSYTSASSLWL